MKFYIDTKKFLPAQLEWWNLKNFYKLMIGGYGSGKTHIGAKRIIRNSYLNAGYANQYVSPSYPIAKKTIIPTIEGMLDSAGISYRHNKTDHEFRIHNWDGIIWIGSGDEPNSLKGPNLASAGIDEPFIQSEEVFKQMTARVRIAGAKAREIFLTGTPEQLNWGYSLAKNKEGKLDVGKVFAKTKDNIYNSNDYFSNLLAIYSEDEIKAYTEGKFINLTSGRVCKPFDEDIHVIKRGDLSDLYKHVPIEGGIDFNVDYMSAEFFFDIGGHIHYFKEFRKSNTDTYEIAQDINAYFKDKTKMPITIYPDATGSARKSSSTRSDHEILRNAGFRIRTGLSNPPVRDRVNAWNKLLRNKLLTIQKGECPYLIEDNEIMIWKNGDLDKFTNPKLTHAFDGGSYPMAYKYPIRDRIIRGIR